jgi:hypothetical protein
MAVGAAKVFLPVIISQIGATSNMAERVLLLHALKEVCRLTLTMNGDTLLILSGHPPLARFSA